MFFSSASVYMHGWQEQGGAAYICDSQLEWRKTLVPITISKHMTPGVSTERHKGGVLCVSSVQQMLTH